jgi:hypothetical protein
VTRLPQGGADPGKTATTTTSVPHQLQRVQHELLGGTCFSLGTSIPAPRTRDVQRADTSTLVHCRMWCPMRQWLDHVGRGAMTISLLP